MAAVTSRDPGYKNAPFELPPDLQADFDETAARLDLAKVTLLAMALRKGLPIVRQFLLDEQFDDSTPSLREAGGGRPKADATTQTPAFSLNAAKPTKARKQTFRPTDSDVVP